MSLRIPLFHRTATVVAGALLGLAVAAPASAHTGELTVTSECADVGWTATWNLTTSDTDGHEGVLSNVKLDISYTHIPPGSGGPPKPAKLTDGAEVTGDTTVSETRTLSQDATRATLTLTLTWQVDDTAHTKTLRAQANAPTDCNWPPPAEPSTLSTAFDCTTMTITLVNPASAKDEVALRLKTSEGEQRSLAAKPGETKSENFPATAGFTVDVTSDGGPQPPGGAQPHTLAYEQPADCSTDDGGEAAGGDSAVGGPAAGNGDGGSLPVTGVAAGAVAGTAAALLATGVVLFVVARRRRVKFTA